MNDVSFDQQVGMNVRNANHKYKPLTIAGPHATTMHDKNPNWVKKAGLTKSTKIIGSIIDSKGPS